MYLRISVTSSLCFQLRLSSIKVCYRLTLNPNIDLMGGAQNYSISNNLQFLKNVLYKDVFVHFNDLFLLFQSRLPSVKVCYSFTLNPNIDLMSGGQSDSIFQNTKIFLSNILDNQYKKILHVRVFLLIVKLSILAKSISLMQ